MTATQECDAPRITIEHACRMLCLCKNFPAVYIDCRTGHSRKIGSELLLPPSIGIFAYGIGRKSTPLSSETGKDPNTKVLFMQMMSEPPAGAEKFPVPTRQHGPCLTAASGEPTRFLIQDGNNDDPSFRHLLEVSGSLHDSAKSRQHHIAIPNTSRFENLR